MVQENPELRSRIVVVPFSKISGVGNVVFRGGAILLPKALVNTKGHASHSIPVGEMVANASQNPRKYLSDRHLQTSSISLSGNERNQWYQLHGIGCN